MSSDHRRSLYLHAGLPKTGTTFIQRNVFPKIRSVQCISNPRTSLFEPRYPWDAALRSIFARAPLVWDHVGVELLRDIVPDDNVQSAGESVLVSDESVFTLATPTDVEKHIDGFRRAAQSLGFTDVRVILSLRRQDQWLASLYAQKSHRFSGASQKHFETWVSDLTDPRRAYYSEGQIGNYLALYHAIEKIVGSDNILILVYEEMVGDAIQFYERLCRFIRIPNTELVSLLDAIRAIGDDRVNVRAAAPGSWRLRDRRIEGAKPIRLRPARFFQRIGMPAHVYLEHLEFRRGSEIRLTSELSMVIKKRYAEGNRRLDDLLDLNLASHGYY